MGMETKDLDHSEFNPASYKFIRHVAAVSYKCYFPFFFFECWWKTAVTQHWHYPL